VPKKGKAFDVCSVSSDDSDEDAIIIIRKEDPPLKAVNCVSQDDLRQVQKKHTEQFL
jgi:hypothetical protein